MKKNESEKVIVGLVGPKLPTLADFFTLHLPDKLVIGDHQKAKLEEILKNVKKEEVQLHRLERTKQDRFRRQRARKNKQKR